MPALLRPLLLSASLAFSTGALAQDAPSGLPDIGSSAGELLSPAPAYLADQPVIGHWPTHAASEVETILESEGRHSMRAFAEAIGAKAVKTAEISVNINTQADLARAATEKTNGI